MSNQIHLFEPVRDLWSVATTTDVDRHLAQDAPVAIGISGGKDGAAAAWSTVKHLKQIGHQGEVILIHSDLGRTEWADSLPCCERLAERLGLELVVVRREAGDMMDRWLTRWANNVERYESLQTVKLILPWSTPSMRFCTSELKSAVIARELTRRFPGKTILSVSGIRRQESEKRRQMPVAKPDKRLTNVSRQTSGLSWHPVIDWDLDTEVWPIHHMESLPIHEAYTVYKVNRVSCFLCIMSAEYDIQAGISDERNHDTYREMVDLEVQSTFSFQDDYWLADAAPWLLTDEVRSLVPKAKLAAQKRQLIEATIPKHLHYTKGWPECIPTPREAVLLGDVRRQVGQLVGLDMAYTGPVEIVQRYEELFELARAQEARKRQKEAKKR